MNVTYKHLRLFVEEEAEGWLAYVCDLDRFQLVYEGRLIHPTIVAAQKEAQAKADQILGEATIVDWSEIPAVTFGERSPLIEMDNRDYRSNSVGQGGSSEEAPVNTGSARAFGS